jgi:hypothetical protein
MKRVAIAGWLLWAAHAHAQAPGQTAPMTSPAAPVTPAPPSTVMDDQWAVGLSMGEESLTPRTGSASQSGAGFGVGELDLRYRPAQHVELSFSLSGGGGTQINLGMSMIAFDVRYRFLAEQAWNWYLIGGIGIASVARPAAGSIESKGRGALRAGAGVERRYQHFAFDAELRLIAISENTEVPYPGQLTDYYPFERYGLSGGSLMFGASYYF